MRAMVIEQWGMPLSLRQVPLPAPGRGDVLVRVRACGAGRTVLNTINGDLSDRSPSFLPRIPGHEIAGEVADVGPDVENLHEGDRVVTYFYLTCGTCRMCRSGKEPLCENFRGFLGVHRDGGYAEYVSVPARSCFHLPAGVDFIEATAIPDAILSPLHVFRSRVRVGPGDRVVVIGAGGGVGIHMVQMARLFGADVWGVETEPAKHAAIMEAGAKGAVDFRSTPAEAIREITGDASAVVDLVGRPETLRWGVGALGPRGVLVVLTTFPGVTTDLDPRQLVFQEHAVVGSRYGSHEELELAIDLVARGRIRPVVTKTAPLEKAEALHAKIKDGALTGRGAVLPG